MKNTKAKKALSLMLVAIMACTLFVPAVITSFASGLTLNVTSANELKQALDMDTEVENINITADFTVTDDCTIKFDSAHLAYYHDTVMTIAENVTLTVGEGGVIGSYWPSYQGDRQTPPLPNAKIINNGTVIVERGGATEADFDTNNGDIIVKGGGKAVCCNVNNGTVTVEEDGNYLTTQGGQSVNNGKITVHRGALMMSRFGTPIINETNGTIELNGQLHVACIGDNEGDNFWFDNKGTMTGNGDVILYEADHNVLPVSDMDSLLAKMMVLLGQQTRFENWEDIFIFKEVDVASFSELKAATPGNRVVAGEQIAGDMDTMINIVGNIDIPSGESIETMARLSVDENATITVNNSAVLECGMENFGTVGVLSGGSLFTTQGGDIQNRGTIIVNSGALLKSQMGAKVVNFDDGVLILNGTCRAGCIGMGENDICWFENFGSITGNGSVELCEIAPDFLPVSDMNALADKVEGSLGVATPLPTVSIHAHSWGEWEQTKAPTCTQTGEALRTCPVCGAEQTKELSVTAHNYKATVTKATLTKNGKITYKCVCGQTKPSVVVYYPKTFTLSVKTYIYDGKAKTPAVTVKDAAGKVIAKSNYTVTYKNNKNPGVASAIITFKGNYSGTKTLSFTINPKTTKLTAVTGAKRAFVAKWAKSTGVTGYQIQYATNAKFGGAKVKAVKGAAKNTLKVGSLKAGARYYVRVRTYKSVGGKNYYSSWSAAKAVKIK